MSMTKYLILSIKWPPNIEVIFNQSLCPKCIQVLVSVQSGISFALKFRFFSIWREKIWNEEFICDNDFGKFFSFGRMKNC